MITKTCAVSGKKFVITKDDLAFYEKMGVPEPTLCPEERLRRRLAFRNHRSLYHGECFGSGKKVVTMYDPKQGYKVYENEYWWSDSWDGKVYGKEIDYSQPFFFQFEELLKIVPKMARVQQGENPNSRYTNCCSYNKNCYLVFTANENEDCLYGTDINMSKNCVDSYGLWGTEIAFQCMDCVDCYEIFYSQKLKNCNTVWYSFDCVGSDNCFGCIGLRQKSYYVLNKKVSKEEFESLVSDTEKQKEMLRKLRTLFLDFPQKDQDTFRCEDSSGDHLNYCKNTLNSFECHSLEDCRYCNNFRSAKTCYDVSYYGCTSTNELLYECEAVGHGAYNIKFSKLCWGGCENLEYCYELIASKDCFGCTGLRNVQYCIFNKQYSEQEYKRVREKLIEHMKKTGEWGEYFPLSISPFAYNEALVIDYFPIEETIAKERGYKWRSDTDTIEYTGPKYVVPTNIKDVENDILDAILVCENTQKNYRILDPELVFYRQYNLPIPRVCPEERHRLRMISRNPWNLWDRKCGNCACEIKTTYAPERPEKVLCEECYLKEVN